MFKRTHTEKVLKVLGWTNLIVGGLCVIAGPFLAVAEDYNDAFETVGYLIGYELVILVWFAFSHVVLATMNNLNSK